MPGAEGIGALAVATAAAMPRRASVRLSPICDCNELSWDWTPELKLESWLTLTASVGLMPAATLVSRRSLPAVPNDTVLANVASEPEPIATEFAASAWLFGPRAVDSEPVATAPSPKAAPPLAAEAAAPIATEPVAVAPVPIAIALTPVAPALPTAMAPAAVEPTAVAFVGLSDL